MKEKILEILGSEDRAYAWEEIRDMMNISENDNEEFSKVLNELCNDYLVHYTNKRKYMLFSKCHLSEKYLKGIYKATSGDYGFVDVLDMDDDVFVHAKNSMGAVNEDLVLLEIIENSHSKKMEGRIVKILKRTDDTHVGTVNITDNKVIVELDDRKFKDKFYIRDETKNGLVSGNKVLVKLINPSETGNLSATVVKVIGHIDDPLMDVLSIAYEYGFDIDFSEKTMEELKEIHSELSESDINERINRGGFDLRNEIIFTIDGDDTKDIDDAISIEKLSNGNYKLGVHIADVSYYVKEGTSLYDDAVLRGTSVYLTNYVLPMLPHQLSNGICSLNPNVDRFALSCIMEINEKGMVVDYKINESVIRSRIQMTYKKVNDILDNDVVADGYMEFKDKLLLMKDLSKILNNMKVLRGSIDFDTDEVKILVDEKGVPTSIDKRSQGVGEKIIEDFMIAANETVASSLYYMDLPSIYRIHEVPDPERIKNFITFLASLGYTINGDLKRITPKSIQELLNSLKDKKEYKILSNQMLRCMKKAIYSADNVGHFGIASKCYSHFTSPIRRLPDLILHRLVRTYLLEHHIDNETINYFSKIIPELALNASVKEKDSVDCEREVEDMKMAEYMESHIGEEFEGMISSITNFGMFVMLDNMVEGLIRLDSLKGYYIYDEASQSLRGKHKDTFILGNRLIIKVSFASKEEKKIDFELVKRVDGDVKKENKKIRGGIFRRRKEKN